MSDEQIAKNHTWDCSKYPAATSNYAQELSTKIALNHEKKSTYQQILQDAKLSYKAPSTGWLLLGDKWYYLNSSGEMAKDSLFLGGK